MLSWFKYIAVIFLLQGCGYSLSHRLKGPFQNPRGIFVRVFDNTTDEIGAESAFTNALVRELMSRGDIRLQGPGKGALELRGTLDAIDQDVTSFSDAGLDQLAGFKRLPSEMGITARIHVDLYDPQTKTNLWSQGFSFYRRIATPIDRTTEVRAASSTGPITQSLLELRYRDLARDIMREMYDAMVELF